MVRDVELYAAILTKNGVLGNWVLSYDACPVSLRGTDGRLISGSRLGLDRHSHGRCSGTDHGIPNSA